MSMFIQNFLINKQYNFSIITEKALRDPSLECEPTR